jgi:hypothetical protein
VSPSNTLGSDAVGLPGMKPGGRVGASEGAGVGAVLTPTRAGTAFGGAGSSKDMPQWTHLITDALISPPQ